MKIINKKLKLLKPFIPILSSVIVLFFIALWFNQTYSKNQIKLNQIIRKEKVATFSIESDEEVSLNKAFTTNIILNTNGNPVNTIGLQLSYQQDSLRIVDIDTRDSFCQFYPEKKINDTLGLITLSCGSPHPGFTGENTVIKIEFQPIKIGITTLTVNKESKILLSDGKGTDILNQYPQKQINILNNL